MVQLPTHEPGTMVEDVPLANHITPAVVIGRHVEWLVSGAGVIGLIVAGLIVGAQRRRTS
jgi:apolipoprotein N-acyltransferase